MQYRAHPFRVHTPNFRRTIVRHCAGFPLGQGQPDYFLIHVPSRQDDSDYIALWTRPTRRHPSEISMVLDDLGPFNSNIRGFRTYDGAYAGRYIYIKPSPLTGGYWYLRAERLQALGSSSSYNLVFDFR